jgi:hypothetical protein
VFAIAIEYTTKKIAFLYCAWLVRREPSGAPSFCYACILSRDQMSDYGYIPEAFTLFERVLAWWRWQKGKLLQLLRTEVITVAGK